MARLRAQQGRLDAEVVNAKRHEVLESMWSNEQNASSLPEPNYSTILTLNRSLNVRSLSRMSSGTTSRPERGSTECTS